jgi:SAM-dependent methyltransferase
MNKNINDLKEHYNNFIYPKPIEDIEEEFIKQRRYYLDDPTYYWHKLWPEKAFNKKKIEVLIAGCGSHQAAILAKCNPHHNFIGIDLSKNSIKHEEKLILKHNINNLKLICDDFRKVKFDNKFDLIISTGVIHHLENPESALNYFYKNIKDDGAISIMVYGNKSNFALNEIKKLFQFLKIEQNQEGIKDVQEFFNKFNPSHPASFFAKQFEDINNSSGVIDFFLHKSEKFFCIKEIIKLLSENGLVIKDFADTTIKSITKFFLYDEKILQKIRKLDCENQWELGQILNWNDRKIQFVCTKKENKKKSNAYFPIKIDDAFICFRDTIKYKIENQKFFIKPETGENFSFNLPLIKDNLLWQSIFTGKNKIQFLINSYDEPEKSTLKNLFTILIENNFVDISCHPIGVDRINSKSV